MKKKCVISKVTLSDYLNIQESVIRSLCDKFGVTPVCFDYFFAFRFLS